MSYQIKLTDEQLDLLKSMGSVHIIGAKKYYFLPFWFESTEHAGKYNVHSFDSLPKELVESEEKRRNP